MGHMFNVIHMTNILSPHVYKPVSQTVAITVKQTKVSNSEEKELRFTWPKEAMDEFFEPYTSLESMLWFEDAPHHVVNQSSAFQRYTNQPFEGLAFNPNVNKKMIEFLKKSSWVAPPLQIETIEQENDRSLKHRIMERMRRQKLKQIYLDLHKLLPLGTKVN